MKIFNILFFLVILICIYLKIFNLVIVLNILFIILRLWNYFFINKPYKVVATVQEINNIPEIDLVNNHLKYKVNIKYSFEGEFFKKDIYLKTKLKSKLLNICINKNNPLEIIEEFSTFYEILFVCIISIFFSLLS
jgi:hypothetical protein